MKAKKRYNAIEEKGLRHRKKGLALIITLIVLTILIILIHQMAQTNMLNGNISNNYIKDLQNSYALQSGLHIASLYLITDLERDTTTDTLQDNWSLPLERQIGETRLTISIEDESTKINLGALVTDKGEINKPLKQMLERLIGLHQFDESNSEMIIDYIDPDIKGNYEQDSKNGSLINLDELLRIKTLEEGLLFGTDHEDEPKPGIMKSLTVWPHPSSPGEKKENSRPEGTTKEPTTVPITGAININTAPRIILMTLSDKITEELAQSIIAYRNSLVETTVDDKKTKVRNTFKSTDELVKVSGFSSELYNEIKGMVTVKSSIFRVMCVARNGTLTKKHLYIVSRQSAQKPIQLIYSQRVYDSFKIPPPPQREE